jgi:putative transposase
MSLFERERTSAEVILYALYLYFLGLSFRNTSKAIQPFGEEGGRSHVAVWKWVQRFNPRCLYCCKRVSAFLIDETMLQIGSDQAWLWVAVEPIHRQILGLYISRHRNMLVAESFLRTLIRIYGKHTVYSDGRYLVS